MCTVFPTNKQNHPHTIHPKRNHPFHAQSAQTKSTVPRAIRPNETVGAAPVCPPERPRSGVSISKTHALCAGDERWMRPCRATRAGSGVSMPKIHAWCAGYLTMDAPLQGDSGGHIGIAPTHLHHIFPRIPHKQNNHLHTIHPKRNQPSHA